MGERTGDKRSEWRKSDVKTLGSKQEEAFKDMENSRCKKSSTKSEKRNSTHAMPEMNKNSSILAKCCADEESSGPAMSETKKVRSKRRLRKGEDEKSSRAADCKGRVEPILAESDADGRASNCAKLRGTDEASR